MNLLTHTCGVPWPTLQEEIAGKEEAALRRLLNENEEVARQRDAVKRRLELMERAAAEIMNFRV